MKKSYLSQFKPGSAQYVVAHAAYRRSRGRKPSMSYRGEGNPRTALEMAVNSIKRRNHRAWDGKVPHVVDASHKIDYSKVEVPPTYVCHICGASGCKLWREYKTSMEWQSLLCAECAAEKEKKNINKMDVNGRRRGEYEIRTDQIGWRIPAVPTEENDTYWGYTSVLIMGCHWWRKLPTFPLNDC